MGSPEPPDWALPAWDALTDEGLPDALEVANGEIALVELAVAQPLLDDLADHPPYCVLIAARK